MTIKSLMLCEKHDKHFLFMSAVIVGVVDLGPGLRRNVGRFNLLHTGRVRILNFEDK